MKKSLLLVPAIAGAVVALTIALVPRAMAETNGDRLEKIVPEMPRNSMGLPMYWLEMESSIGWETMILIFGYVDNRAPCERLQEIAALDAPDRRFRCVIAN